MNNFYDASQSLSRDATRFSLNSARVSSPTLASPTRPATNVTGIVLFPSELDHFWFKGPHFCRVMASSSSFDSSFSVASYLSFCSEDSNWSCKSSKTQSFVLIISTEDSSSMSEATPYKTGTNDLHLYKRLVMDLVLQRKLDGNPYEDVTIQQFVEDIWGLDPKIITDRLTVEWVLKESAVATYDTLISCTLSRDCR